MDQNMEDSGETWLRQLEKEGKHAEFSQGPGWAWRDSWQSQDVCHPGVTYLRDIKVQSPDCCPALFV